MTKLATNEKTEQSNMATGEKLITKIKLTPAETLEVNYKLSNDKEALEVLYVGKEEVTAKFSENFEKLTAVACQIVPMLENAPEEDLSVGILRLKYNDNGFLDKVSLSIKLLIEASNSPINISTPMVDFTKEDMSDFVFRISQENEELIHEVVALTKAYMNGDTRTKQLSLVVDNEE